ncbi:NTP pyrophosphohydrolase [Thermopolyspora flexuosa]|uniref:ADP-ribose pyrophosphatase YjhB (NUDIX family) n=1 Tax=Thermopolyspora flexuosa TaxID=103836 RepID=A0A543IPC0_9ACTN|nr:NUDIX domain-containing protein [Thermopolyspora flexuosa]TQM72427.1 ADP-ribose pyrophosphatase YjhB (NUDIX family) [Thermopolyspora flexuosa]GGM70666.1 NTP pyrophosphohydrolase [Thermopolyspora flexuosa]
MTVGDGDGWTLCGRGHRHWGVHGASGLLAVHHGADGTPYVLLQKRALWSHHGGTWGLPGGATDSHEDAITGALREAREEAALDAGALRVCGVYVDDHGGWAFQTVIAQAASLLEATPGAESVELRWLPADEIASWPLHPGFAETWPAIRRELTPVTVVLDAANIVGARAEHGWWRDRAEATRRLLDEVGRLARAGLRRPVDGGPGLAVWFPRMTMVVEGAARGVEPVAGVGVVAASGSGDDAIVEEVRRARPWERVVVVTADRALRDRVAELGAAVAGPRWLLSQM